MVVDMHKASTRRGRAAPSRVRSTTARRNPRAARRPAHRKLLDLYGIELYAVISYRLALAVLAVITVLYMGK